MFIVYIGKQKHSAWDTEEQAEKQKRVLRENGYGGIHQTQQGNNLWIDEIEACYENGHYFV